MPKESETTFYYKIGCKCGSKIMCKDPMTDEAMRQAGWSKHVGSWYCDECEPYHDDNGGLEAELFEGDRKNG